MTPTRARRAAARGFTLLELMIGSAASIFVMTGITISFIAIQRSYSAEAQIKGAVENSRLATGLIERELRMAGYGIDPRYAFDFTTNVAGAAAKDNVAGTGFVTDDLAFRYRDPTFLRMGYLSTGDGTLNLVASTGGSTFGVTVKKGTGLLLICQGGRNFRFKRANAASNGNSVAVVDGGWGSSTTWTSHSCLNDSNQPAYVALVREVRLRVVDLNGRPYLVRFNNLDSPSDPIGTNTDFDPVAIDVENFQVSYVMNRPSAGMSGMPSAPDAGGNQDWVIGNAVGEGIPDVAATAPTFDTPYTETIRFNANPANIRAVRVSLVVRSPSTRPDGRRSQAPFDVENSNVTNTVDGYYRTLISTSVRTPNLLSRAGFVPPLIDPANPTAGCTQIGTTECDMLNVWGG